jgi:hypothetical protein
MAYHQVCDQSCTKGATRKAGAACPSGAHEFTPDFSGVVVARSLVFFVVFLRLLFFFVLFLLIIVLSVLRFTDIDYPFGIFKFFLLEDLVMCDTDIP